MKSVIKFSISYVLIKIIIEVKSLETLDSDISNGIRPINGPHNLLKKLQISEINPKTDLIHTYNFLFSGEYVDNIETSPNKFYFDMVNYSQKFTNILGEDINLSNGITQNEQHLEIGGFIIRNIKLPSQVSKVEIEIIENDCLTLFLFLDPSKFTNLNVIPDAYRVILDLQHSSIQNFSQKADDLESFTSGSIHKIFNNLGYQGESIFLKVFCPFYSSFKTHNILLSIKLHFDKHPLNSTILTSFRIYF